MNRAAQEDLFKDAERLAYDAIKFSDLRKSLSSAEWDQFSAELGKDVLDFIQGRIVAREVLIEEQEARVA